MTFTPSRLTGISARLIARSSVLAVFALSPLAAKEPIGSLSELKKKQEAVCLRTAGDSVSKGHNPQLPSRFQSQSPKRSAQQGVMLAAVAGKYTLSQLSAMSYTDMVNTLVAPGMTWENVTDLWSYSPSAQTFYSDTYRVQALIDAISSRGASFTATDNKGIPTLVEVLRAGFYHGWYHSAELPAMNDRATHNKCLPAIRQAQANPNFSMYNAAGCDVIAAMGILIANASCDPGIVRNFQNVLSQFNTNFEAWAGDHDKGTAWFNVCNGIDADLYNDVRNNGQVDPATLTEWYGQINYFLEEIFTTAGKPSSTYTSTNAWAIDAAIYYASRAGKFHGTPNRALQVITNAMNIYGKSPWKYASAQAAQMIHLNYKDVDYNGNTLNWTQIQNEIRSQYLPQTRTFDGGLFSARYGTNVQLEKLKTLVWAHKETKAQFFRTVGADTPADPKQTCDNNLQIIVYNSPDEYRMNGVAYGLDTNNGGMYIEGDGTFYTYERTPQESIYSLEELFRHEGVHYLQGRYMVPGMWGSSSLYDNNRLTWFEEGGAEWHAGSTRTSGIKNRPTKTEYIPTNISDRMTISALIHTGYGSFDFYDYGNNLLDFLYNTGKQDTYLNMTAALRANNAANFDSLATGLTKYESAYQNHLTTLLNNSASYPAPSTSADYLAIHPVKTVAALQSEITTATGLTGVTISTTKDTDWSTFTLRGTFTGGASTGLLSDWTAMSAKVDGWLNSLATNSWSGYKTLTGYFVNYRKDASNRVVYDVVFHGVCTDPAVANNKNPIANISGPTTGTPLVAMNFSGTGSSDPDGTISSYAWDFGDGATATGVTTSHAFAKPGTYPVKLTVTDNFGATNVTTLNVVQEYTSPITAEWEPNDDFATACGPVGSGVNVAASVGGNDNRDYFFFDTYSAGDVKIGMTGTNITWVLYHSSDQVNYAGYMLDPTTTVTLTKTGRYYVMAYASGTGGNYTLNVSGTPLTKPNAGLSFTTQPLSQSITLGSPVTFTAAVSGGKAPYTYQWTKNGAAISGATSATYTFTPVQADNAAQFALTAKDASSPALSATSSPATLTVTAANAVTITSQPVSQSVTAGAKATFSVVATGNGLTYQWYRMAPGANTGTAISGATAATYTTPATIAGDNNAKFYVVVSGTSPATPVTSSQATLTVTQVNTVTITTQPAPQSVVVGAKATFSVVATGTGLTYQWYKVPASATTGSAISGATAATYTTPATVAGDNNAKFYVTVSGSAPATPVTSSQALLTVKTNPTDTAAPTVNLVVSTTPGSATAASNATDDVAVTKVTFWLDGASPVDVTTAPFTYTFSTTGMTPGSTRQVACRAYDATGKYADSPWVPFTVVGTTPVADTTAPTVSVKATPGTNGSVTYTATASDNVGVAKVIFYTDNWSLFTTDTAAPWTATATGLSKGTHYVLAEARDAANNVAYTAWVSFVIP